MQQVYDPYQLSFAEAEAEALMEQRLAHPDRIINAMRRLPDEAIVAFCRLCEPYYHTRGGQGNRKGRPCAGLEMMARIHLLQDSLNLSDKEMEQLALADVLVRSFCHIPLGRGLISDTTILRFRHFVEAHGLGAKFLATSNAVASAAGALEHNSVAVDATFVNAADSTKNKDHARDPEMASGKKANTWHFGMKVHIAVSTMSGVVYSVVGGPANEHDITRLHDVLLGDEVNVFLDSGYTGCEKRPEILGMNLKKVKWYIAEKPSAWKKLAKKAELAGGDYGQKLSELVELTRSIEHAKASVRCTVEWAFFWLKRVFGYAKARYRGLAKNLTRVQTLFSIYNWHCVRRWRQRHALAS